MLEPEPEPMVLVQKSSVQFEGRWNQEPNLIIGKEFLF
jgi:hypothetical protein